MKTMLNLALCTVLLSACPVFAQTAPASTPPTPTPTTPTLTSTPVSTSTPAPTSATTPLVIGGSLGAPVSLTLADLRALPVHEVSLSYTAAGQTLSHTYRGALLFSVLTAARPTFDARIKNDALNWYVQAKGNDGYAALFSWAELDPGFGNRAVLLAYEEDGKPFPAADGAVRLVVPGDLKGGRYVSNLIGLQVLRAGN